jgi:hypothetical protein
VSRVLGILVALAIAFVGCGEPPNGHPGYDGGERFRITVIGYRDPRDTCDASPLHAGDRFELTALDALRSFGDGSDCDIRAAVGVVPEFLRPVITKCDPGPDQLGLECTGSGPDGCAVFVMLSIGPHIEKGERVIEDGLLNLTWGGCPLPTKCGGAEQ